MLIYYTRELTVPVCKQKTLLRAMLPRIGIVATPDQVSLLVPILHSLKFQVTAVWCKSSDVCRKLTERFSIPSCASTFTELLLHPEVDLVYVATEPGMHAEVAVKALTSGKHCICQTPPSICRSEAEKMVSLSRYYSQLMSILENHLRFLPAVTKMKELIASEYVGKLLVMEGRVLMGSLIHNEPYSWKCDSMMGGGVLNAVGAHIVDLVSFLGNQQAQKVHGCLKTFRPHTEKIYGYRTITSDDFCSFQMHCSDDLSATVTLNTHAPGKFSFEFSVTGTEGRLTVKGMDLYGCKNLQNEKLFLKQEPVSVHDLQIPPHFPMEFYQPIIIGCREMFKALKFAFEGSKDSLLVPRRQMHGTVHRGLLPAATFEDGNYIRTVLDAIFESHAIGKWVDIPKVRLIESVNPFWTSSSVRDVDKPSPKSHRPVFV